MTFLYKVKLCNASLAEINGLLETAIKDLFCAAKSFFLKFLFLFKIYLFICVTGLHYLHIKIVQPNLLYLQCCFLQEFAEYKSLVNKNLHKDDNDKDDDDETLVGLK